MTEIKDLAVFKRYNPKEDIVRCPYGKSPLRAEIHEYLLAAVNLYAKISIDDFIDLFKHYTDKDLDRDLFYTLMLPWVHKKEDYCFYKDNIIDFSLIDNLEDFEIIVDWQSRRPRYLPSKEKFLGFSDYYYDDNPYQYKMFKFIIDKSFIHTPVSQIMETIRDYSVFGYSLAEILEYLEEQELNFTSEEDIYELIELVQNFHNNQRSHLLNGHSPAELFDLEMKARQEEKASNPFPEFDEADHRTEKVGRNDPCPCRSGKKYKKCCLLNMSSPQAKLTVAEMNEFYAMLDALLRDVNHRLRLYPVAHLNGEDPEPYLHAISEHLWEDPELILDFLKENADDLEAWQVETYADWYEKFMKGHFWVLRYTKEGALFLAMKDDPAVYLVKGLMNPVGMAMQMDVPVMVEAVLLPFKGKIVYDTFLSSFPIAYTAPAQAALYNLFDEELEKGLVTEL